MLPFCAAVRAPTSDAIAPPCRGDKFRGDFQALYDEGIQVALKYLGE